MKPPPQPPIRILLAMPTFTAGGAEKVMIAYANALAEDPRYQPALLVVNGKLGTLAANVAPGVKVFRYGWPKIYLAAPLVAWVVLRFRPAVVFSTMADLNFAVLATRPLFPRLPMVVREAINPSFFSQAVPHRYGAFLKLWKRLYPWATHVVANSPQALEELAAIVPNLPPATLLNNPVDEAMLRQQAASAKLETPKTGKAETGKAKPYRMVAMGRLSTQKGFDRLIAALAKSPPPFAWTLAIHGHGDAATVAAFQKQIDKAGLAANITLAGHTTAPGKVLGAAHVFLLPSRAEGMPNVALEALACGTPVVAMAEAGAIATLAAQAPKGAVQLANSMQGFMKLVAKRPAPAAARPSLLPKAYRKDTVMADLKTLLQKAMRR